MTRIKMTACGSILAAMLLGGCGQVGGTASTFETFPTAQVQDAQPGNTSSLADLVMAKIGGQIQGQPAYMQRIVTHPVTDPTYLAQGYTVGFTAYVSTDPTGQFGNNDFLGVEDTTHQQIEWVDNNVYEGIIAPPDGQWVIEEAKLVPQPLNRSQSEVQLNGKDYFGQTVQISAGHYVGSTPTRTNMPAHYDYYDYNVGTFADGYRAFAPTVLANLLNHAHLQSGVSAGLIQEAIQLIQLKTLP